MMINVLQNQLHQNKKMSSLTTTLDNRSETILHMKAVTWMKDSHSLFDYQFNKNITQNNFDISLNNKFVYMYRNNHSKIDFISASDISVKQHDKLQQKPLQGCQFLGCFQLSYHQKKAKVRFHHAYQFSKMKKHHEQHIVTEGSAMSSDTKQEDIYLIVRSLKNVKNQNKGFKLQVGQTVKIGRVQYRISSLKKTDNGETQEIPQASSFFDNYRTAQCKKIQFKTEDEELFCKYCLTNDQTDPQNFLMSPCKCSGSSGVVHFKCLEQWIKSKVKKEVVGGTTQYNFEKFYCQLCKLQFPRFINRQGETHELMPITKPQNTSYVLLQGITQKSNNLMVIHNVPQDGIRIGRSHQCEIRITDISVSRNHAKIQRKDNEFIIFDSKSKFGTLVKEDNLCLQIDKIKQGVQIGRTVITFQLSKKQK